MRPLCSLELVQDPVRSASGRSLMSGFNFTFTDRVRWVLQAAREEAARLRNGFVGTEHLLLGLLREEKGVAAQVLTEAGVTLERARAEALRILGDRASAAGLPAPGFEVRIDDSSDRAIHEQIVAQIQEAVATGTLRPGNRLPPVRQLADQLEIAPGTVARAYSELERRGIVVTDGARGKRGVASVDVDRIPWPKGPARP